MIGHAKADNRMGRCWLKGSEGDARHAVLCAAGFNIRWLLRAIARLGLGAIFCALRVLAAYDAVIGSSTASLPVGPHIHHRRRPRSSALASSSHRAEG
jgi:transposase, IS5 family